MYNTFISLTLIIYNDLATISQFRLNQNVRYRDVKSFGLLIIFQCIVYNFFYLEEDYKHLKLGISKTLIIRHKCIKVFIIVVFRSFSI